MDKNYRSLIAVLALIAALAGWFWSTSRINFHTRVELYRECLSIFATQTKEPGRLLYMNCTAP